MRKITLVAGAIVLAGCASTAGHASNSPGSTASSPAADSIKAESGSLPITVDHSIDSYTVPGHFTFSNWNCTSSGLTVTVHNPYSRHANVLGQILFIDNGHVIKVQGNNTGSVDMPAHRTGVLTIPASGEHVTGCQLRFYLANLYNGKVSGNFYRF